MVTLQAVAMLFLLTSLAGCIEGKARPAADGAQGHRDLVISADRALPPGDGPVGPDAVLADKGDTLQLDTVEPGGPSGMFCVISGGGWAPLPCTSNADCAGSAYKICVGQVCRQCADDSDCAVGPQNTGKCDSSNLCLECDSAADCQAAGLGAVCSSTGRCLQCTVDSHCVKGTGNTGKCQVAFNRCTRCQDDADCIGTGLGARCDLDNYWCVTCLTDSDCVAGPGRTAYCHQKACTGCKTEQDCVAAGLQEGCICQADDPGTTPNEDTCPPGQVCVNKLCEPE